MNTTTQMVGGKALTEYTRDGLLKLLAVKVEEYRRAQTDELDYLSDHDNRDFWDDDAKQEYNEIMDEVNSTWNEVRKIVDFVKELN